MFIVLLAVILAVSVVDYSRIRTTGSTGDKIFFLVFAIASIAYGYYYSKHLYSASVTAILLRLFRIPY